MVNYLDIAQGTFIAYGGVPSYWEVNTECSNAWFEENQENILSRHLLDFI